MMIIASFMNHHKFFSTHTVVYRFYDSLCLVFRRPLIRALLNE